LNRTLFVYDWIDDYSLFSHLPEAVVETQDWFLRHADVVFASSSVLVQRAATLRTGSTYLFPNGVDFEHWQSTSSILGTSALQHIPHPIVGYFGTLSHWIDREVILGVSTQYPLWQFVFIGPRADNGFLDPVFARPNCHWLDSQPYETLPGLAARFDVCWMPFRQTDLTEAINPVKIYEYLALGKPVVAPPLPDLIQLGTVVKFAVNTLEYGQLINKMIHDEKKGSREDERCLQARRFRWSKLWQQAGNHVSESLSKYR
jgi:glycosyltransferase involved in cell wall biosynthesis